MSWHFKQTANQRRQSETNSLNVLERSSQVSGVLLIAPWWSCILVPAFVNVWMEMRKINGGENFRFGKTMLDVWTWAEFLPEARSRPVDCMSSCFLTESLQSSTKRKSVWHLTGRGAGSLVMLPGYYYEPKVSAMLQLKLLWKPNSCF